MIAYAPTAKQLTGSSLTQELGQFENFLMLFRLCGFVC